MSIYITLQNIRNEKNTDTSTLLILIYTGFGNMVLVERFRCNV